MSRHRSKIQISPTVTTAVNGNNTKLHQTQTILCSHPKHAEYESSLKKTVQSRAGKNLSMIRVPKRMVLALGVREGSLICRRCLVKTDKDPEYLNNPKFVTLKSKTKRNLSSNLKIEMEGFKLDETY